MPKSVNRASKAASINRIILILISLYRGNVEEMDCKVKRTPFIFFYKYVLEVEDYILEFSKIDYNKNS